ncbi:MAG: branched-chain amino acid ABC transporter permease [Pseudomonadota bacterium]
MSTETASAPVRAAGNAGVKTFGREITFMMIFSAIVLTMPFWITLIGGYQGLATKIMVWAIFAVGFDILLGFTGLLSFGHAAFFGGAAYITGVVFRDYTSEIIVAFLASQVGVMILAVIIGFLSIRRTGIYFSILTLAFASMLFAAALAIFAPFTGGYDGLTMRTTPSLFGMPMQGLSVFYMGAFMLIFGFAVARTLKNSAFGLMLRSIKENPMRLEYTGVNVWAYKMAAFIISAHFAAVAGFLMVVYEPYVATKFLHWSTSGEVVIMSVIGGVGTLLGPIIGAAFLMYFENVVQSFIGEQWKLVLGLIFVLVVIFLPGGFMQLGSMIWKATGQKAFGGAPPPEGPRKHDSERE